MPTMDQLDGSAIAGVPQKGGDIFVDSVQTPVLRHSNSAMSVGLLAIVSISVGFATLAVD